MRVRLDVCRRENMSAKAIIDTPIQSGEQSFDRVLKAGLSVAALFWSGSKLDPELESELTDLARAEAGRLLVVKIKREDSPGLARSYNISAPVALIAFRNGSQIARADNPTRANLSRHVEFLLGRATRPPTVDHPATTKPNPSRDGKPITISDATFEREVLQSVLPVVVDFWAPWCGPCRIVAPPLEKIAAESAGRLRVAKLNVDENPRTAERFQVQGIPTLLFVKNGRVVDRVVGALPEPQIKAKVDQLLRG
jgi:thioredoxin